MRTLFLPLLILCVVGCAHTSPLGTHSESYPVVNFHPNSINVIVYPPADAAGKSDVTPAPFGPMGVAPGAATAGGPQTAGDGDWSPRISIQIGQDHAGSQSAEPDISASAAATLNSPSGTANADAKTDEGDG